MTKPTLSTFTKRLATGEYAYGVVEHYPASPTEDMLVTKGRKPTFEEADRARAALPETQPST